MKNGKLLDLYSDYLISAFGQTTATGLSSLLDGEVSHDQMQRSLAGEEQTSADLWRIAKPHVRQIESEMVLRLWTTVLPRNHTPMRTTSSAGTMITPSREPSRVSTLSRAYITARTYLCPLGSNWFGKRNATPTRRRGRKSVAQTKPRTKYTEIFCNKP